MGVPFLMAKIGQSMGWWSSIDSLYLSIPWLFWVTLVLTRVLFAAVWILIDIGFHKVGKAFGFFWFAPERKYYSSRPDSVDQSGTIIKLVGIAIEGVFVAELAIRLFTWTSPPYLPPS